MRITFRLASLISMLLVALVAATPAQAAQEFTDVPPGTQFYDEINWMKESGLSTGYPDGTYRPQATVSREAMAAFMFRFYGDDGSYTPPASSPFSDVPTSHQFYREIAWMREAGISTGYTDGTYKPGQPVNRDAMAAFMYRFEDFYVGETKEWEPDTDPTVFSDVGPGNQFLTQIDWMYYAGISTGYDDGTYRPVQPVNRDAMAAFMFRFDDALRGDCGRGDIPQDVAFGC